MKLRQQGYTSNNFWLGGLFRVLEGTPNAIESFSQIPDVQKFLNSRDFLFVQVYVPMAGIELGAARSATVGLSMKGRAFELGQLEKHLAGTPAAAKEAAAKGAHVFNDLSTMSRVESEIFARGIYTGSRGGVQRYGLLFDEPIGIRIGEDGKTMTLNYGQLKLSEDGVYYHLFPRAKGPGKSQ